MYRIWEEATPLPRVSELTRIPAERVTIKPFEPEKDGYIFLHGVALAKFKGRLYCTWAHNRTLENSDDEELNYAVSDDGGKTWSGCIPGNCAPDHETAVSHGAFLVHEGTLYLFAPQFRGQLGKDMMKMSAYVLDEETDGFRYQGVALDERFWPMCEPVLLENGNYIMAGIYVASGYRDPENTAAVAISHGSDVLHWDMVKLGYKDGIKVWGECSVIADGARIALYCREHSRKLKALYAESLDFGRTWTELYLSNLPMIDSKPYAGTLSTGERYLICSCADGIQARDPLTIALSRRGEEAFSRIYVIDEGRTLSYPYAIEADGKLYVAYSSTTEGKNRNSAELAIIDIKDLTL